ncbi:MAG: AAA family ATPase [Holosporaceae bacterium]|jgi:DNA polymerase-3 subunit delta'|nr:AAA family ATPase [Holosporaceae bacterium]
MISGNVIHGHERAELLLANAIRKDRIFPSWIFHGPFGVGKSTIAHRFAAHLLSEEMPESERLDIDADNSTCRLMNSGTHPDFFLLKQSDESISLESTRNLFLKIRKAPSLSKWRAVIVENASRLNANIYNSLLKVLEDPPKQTVIIMICDNLGTIPKTLLSRAAKVSFSPLDESAVEKILRNMGLKEAKKLAQLSSGSVGYALYLHENNGLEIYRSLLDGFSSAGADYKKALKCILANGWCDNFRILRSTLLKILKTYTNMLGNVVDENCAEEALALKPSIPSENERIIEETEKVHEIVSLLNRGESMALDKSSILLWVFERFFSGRGF